MHSHKILNIAPSHPHLQDSLSKELGISKILGQILINRGIKNVAEAEKFLKTKLNHLEDPYSFEDMGNAVRVIKKAAAHKDRVMIFGDYDVDGITSLALLKNQLTKIGLDVLHYLPHRVKEGYGLNKNILNIAKEKKIKLLLTVDCGTNSHEVVGELRRKKIEVIITDHHEPLNCELPAATAIINPKIKNSTYKYRDLAGVGVAYKLAQALTKEKLFTDLDLVTLGTIADVVPLTGENRVIVKYGLKRLSDSSRIGIKALIETSGISNKKITSTFVSYILGPRINASGRMDSAETALSLLMSRKKEEAESLARILEGHNRQRQKIESKILDEAQGIIDREVNFKEHKIIVIAKQDWHEGVLGIVASKLADRFYRPAIVISLTEDLCKGSGRSIKNFHLFDALSECKTFLKSFGGHSHAVGLIISKDNIEDFKRSINDLAKEKLSLEDLLPGLDVEMEMALSDLNSQVVEELDMLEPFGAGNTKPLFYTRNLKLKGQPQVLGRDTLKFWVSDGRVIYPAIGFGMRSFCDSLLNAEYIDLIYNPRIDQWQGERGIILEAEDIFFR